MTENRCLPDIILDQQGPSFLLAPPNFNLGTKTTHIYVKLQLQPHRISADNQLSVTFTNSLWCNICDCFLDMFIKPWHHVPRSAYGSCCHLIRKTTAATTNVRSNQQQTTTTNSMAKKQFENNHPRPSTTTIKLINKPLVNHQP